MCGSGKSGTSTSNQTANVSAPGNVTAWGTQLYNQAYNVAQQPFQSYGGEFVAPVNPQQTTAIGNINTAADTYSPYAQAALSSVSPYFGAATGALGQGLSAGTTGTNLALQGTAANAQLNPNAVAPWMSPYIQNVVQATENQQQQQNQIQQNQLTGNAIQSGAFGGDRAGVAAANLAYQQNLANQPVIANLYNQGYGQALSAAQQQQQAGLSAAAQYGSLANQLYGQGLGAAQQYANLGTGLSGTYSGLGTTQQQNQLQAANAQLGAGTLQQQTQQALDTALYNQFLQKQAYPFQTTQFLSNILQGVAPLFGTTTTSTGTSAQPISFFKRGGRVQHFTDLEMDDDGVYRPRKAGGGGLSDDTLAQLIAAHGQMYTPGMGVGQMDRTGGISSAAHGETSLPVAHLPSIQVQRTPGSISQGMSDIQKSIAFGEDLSKLYKGGKDAIVGTPATRDAKGNAIPATGGLLGTGGKWDPNNGWFGQQVGGLSSSPSLGGAQSVMTLDPSGGISGAPSYDPSLTSTPDLGPIYRRGGRVGLAYGGIPYAGGIADPYIPTDLGEPLSISNPLEAASLQQGMSGGNRGGGGQQSSGLGSAIGTVGNLALKALPFILAFSGGGRIHKDSGGATGDPTPLVPDDDLFPKMLVGESGNRQFKPNGDTVISPKGAVGIAQVMPSTGPEAAKLAGLPWDEGRLYTDSDYNKALGRAYYDQQRREFGDPHVAAAAYNAGPAAVRSAQTRAQKEGGSYLDYLPKETQSYVSALMPGQGNAPAGLSAFVPSALSPNAPASTTQPSWWDRESGGLSGTERGIISLLSGLGGMASSPSRFFGGALLSGLGAGANTYGQLAQKGRALDIQQQQANTAVGRLGIEGVRQSTELYNRLLQMAQAAQRNGQQPPAWITDQIRQLNNTLYGYMPGAGLSAPGTAIPAPTSVGAMPTQTAPLPPPVHVTPLPAPSAGSTTAPAVPSGQPPAAAPTGMPQPRINDPQFLSQLPNEMNPQWLMARSEELGNLGDKEGADKMRAEAQRLSEKYVNDGKAILPGGKVVNVPGWSEAAAAQHRVPENQKWIDDQATQAVARSQARETLGVIQKVLENYQPGSLAGIKANAQALGKALGIDVPDSATMNAEAYDLFVKSTLQNVFQTVKDIGGKPLVSEIEGLKRAVPNPELQPGANRQMLAQLYSRLDQADKLYQDVAPDLDKNAGLNRGKWTADWLNKKENDIKTMAANRQKDIAVRGATPALGKMEEGSTYILEPGSEGAYGIQSGALGSTPMKAKYLGMKDGRPQFKRVE